ncbi:alpha/beta hydrolase [Flavisolibacter sp. BT320]|nr:alpha/beta hydrolase [Flavisolibacter longurius]
MTNYIILFVLLVYGTHLCAQENQAKTDDVQVALAYKKAKADFLRFEDVHGNFIQTRNIRMHYLTWGHSSGIPLIWAHGSFSNAYELLPVADSLVIAGYYVIGIDYYGHGQTPIPAHEVSLHHVADDIADLMDHRKIKKAVIGGWSRGCAVATAFYDAYPDRVLGLVLEDGGSVAMNNFYHRLSEDSLQKRVSRIYYKEVIDSLYLSERAAYRVMFDTSVKSSQFDNLAWIQKTGDGRWGIGHGLFKLFNMQTPKQFIDNIQRSTAVPLFAASAAVLEPRIIYRNLHVPMLILDPISKDDLQPFEQQNAALQRMYPHLVSHKIYENTGHNIHFERKNEFIADLGAFLKRINKYSNVK